MIIATLSRIIPHEVLPPFIAFFRQHLTDEVCEKEHILYKLCYKFLWQCAPKYELPKLLLCLAWSTFPAVPVLENQLIDIANQLQPTNKTYPIAIDPQTLKLETKTSAIAQKLCTKIYRKADYSDIPQSTIRLNSSSTFPASKYTYRSQA
jgi:hypothetical protein